MPEDVKTQFTWGYWFMVMIPWAAIVIVLSYFAITKLFGEPAEGALTMTKDGVERQIQALGPMNREERITAVVLGVCVVFWILESFTGIPAVVPTLFGTVTLLTFGVLNVADYNSKVPWHIITFSGGVIAIAGVLNSVGIVKWIETAFGPSLSGVASNPYIFVTVGSIFMLLARFVLVDHMTAFTMFIIIFAPFCAAAGINPMIAGIVAYANVMPFIAYYQNIQFIVAFEAFGGEEKIPFGKVMPYYFVFTAICVAALLASVPYWSMLGLLSYVP
jgi:di/tricarboxylate transporter